jgi:hypothetical protein
MNKFHDRMRACALVSACLAAALIAPRLAGGEECECPAKKASATGCPMQILSKVPYISRLFRVVGTECPNDAERIGVDFEFCVDGECPLGLRLLECSQCDAAACSAAKACCDAKCCSTKCCAETSCTEKCGAAKCSTAKCCAAKGCEAQVCTAGQCKATACCAAAKLGCCEGKLVAKEACQSEACQCSSGKKCCCEDKCQCANCACGDSHPSLLTQHLLTLTAKNAELEARLEARDQRDELLDQLIELSTENARLSAKLELAEAKTQIVQQMMQMALENQHLKTQLAELADKRNAESVRTTVRPPSSKPVR